ncbi:Alpha/Beta hydrolase protein [Cercophora scortea]|uniref:Alpha/Beta hydrolase protein n=1 Tax=Cercophora scortea TaxID=314031 RepID=A0AAE0MJL4_9PEZI|nr:Alpha/Beta hydrolase protein [Cercophora scortea]
MPKILLRRVITPDPSAGHTHTIIFLHGRGDTAGEFAHKFQEWTDSKGRNLCKLFPSVKWVFPWCKKRPAVADNGAPWSQWFDVWDSTDFSDHEEVQAKGLRESIVNIRNIIKPEARLLGGRWDRVILAGVSQGGATSVHTLLNLVASSGSPRRLGALMAFCCRMPFPGRTLAETRAAVGLVETDEVPADDEMIRNTPVLLQHNRDDEIVRVEDGRELRDTLRRFGATVTWQEYPSGGHWLHEPKGVEDVAAWLTKYVFNPAARRESLASKKKGDTISGNYLI